jgi:TetR/AcrR family transcriptional regulator, tetracycline repressor protein
VISSTDLNSGAPPARDEGERTRLTRATVVDRALRLADADGLEALTIRKLAAELGVTPMALYWHFRSKDELLEGLAERVWSEIDVAVDGSAPWPAQLRGLLESLLRVLRAHPAAPQLLMQGEKQSEAALNATEVTLEVLRGAGFDPQDASAIARSALWTGLMLVMSEPGVEWLTADERTEAQRKKQVALASLPPARYPRLVECAIPMTACNDPELHYEFGVSMFMAGVEAMAAKITQHGNAELARTKHPADLRHYQSRSWPWMAQRTASEVTQLTAATVIRRRRIGRPADQRRPMVAARRASPVTI